MNKLTILVATEDEKKSLIPEEYKDNVLITGIAWSMMIKAIADKFVYNIPLKKTCNLLLYKLDDYSDEEINKFEEVISKIAKAKKAGVDDETLELLASFLPDIKDK